LSLWQIKKENKKKQNRLRNWRRQNHEKVLTAAISSQPIETPKIETPKLWKGLSCYFNPPTNYQVLAPLRSEDVVTIAQATMVWTKEVSQTSSEGIKQTTQSNSSNIEDEQVHIEKKLNLRTPLLIFPAFGTLELIIEKGWLVFSEKKKQ